MKIARPKSLTELVVAEVRARIIDGRLKLGEALSENALAADLGISKTPVREALLQLKLERLVEVQPQRGTYVFQLAPDEVEQVSELREVLELAAVAAAIERNHRTLLARLTDIFGEMRAAYEADDTRAYRTLDGEFHQVMFDCCGNSYIADANVPVAFRMQALRTRLSAEAALNQRSFKEHRDMLKFVRAKDVAALQRLLRAHIRQTRESYLEVLERRETEANAAAA
jgi:DNA-binding GntR family transcriptional regulator